VEHSDSLANSKSEISRNKDIMTMVKAERGEKIDLPGTEAELGVILVSAGEH
jgi:hypothetical protein